MYLANIQFSTIWGKKNMQQICGSSWRLPINDPDRLFLVLDRLLTDRAVLCIATEPSEVALRPFLGCNVKTLPL